MFFISSATLTEPVPCRRDQCFVGLLFGRLSLGGLPPPLDSMHGPDSRMKPLPVFEVLSTFRSK
jgi:hypothetical protein